MNQRRATFLIGFPLCLPSLGLCSQAVALESPEVGAEIRVVGCFSLKLAPLDQNEFVIKMKELARITRAVDDVIA